MNVGRTVFTQLMEFIPMHEFRVAVKRYTGNRRVRRFSCWDQFLCMAFAQLTYRESLRDIETCLRSLGPKLYHTGIRGSVARSTLADANEHRSWELYRDVALALIQRARSLYRNDTYFRELETAVYAFDSTTIELCLSIFPWARAAGHTTTNAAIKLHTLFDIHANIPTFLRISSADRHDVLMLDQLAYEAGAYYLLDRGYMDFARLKRIDTAQAFFIIRAKRRLRYTRVYSHAVDKTQGILVDQTISLDVWRTHEAYPDHVRRIKIFDAERHRTLVFLTNNFLLEPLVIAQLFRARWQIELFFKWIKQHLRIKAFFGTSPNAVKTQVWIAVSIYALVAIVKKELGLRHSLYTILQILSVTMFEKEPLYHVLADAQHLIHDSSPANQLNLFDF